MQDLIDKLTTGQVVCTASPELQAVKNFGQRVSNVLTELKALEELGVVNHSVFERVQNGEFNDDIKEANNLKNSELVDYIIMLAKL